VDKQLIVLWAISGFVGNTTDATSVVKTNYHSEAYEFTPVFSGDHVTPSLVLWVMFVDRCLSLCTLYFDHCVVCHSIYEFGFPTTT
jgi:hypothetical protein